MATGTISHTVQTIADKDVYKVKVLLFCTQASLLWAELKSNHSLGFTFSDLLLASNTNIPCVFIIIDVFFFLENALLMSKMQQKTVWKSATSIQD